MMSLHRLQSLAIISDAKSMNRMPLISETQLKIVDEGVPEAEEGMLHLQSEKDILTDLQAQWKDILVQGLCHPDPGQDFSSERIFWTLADVQGR